MFKLLSSMAESGLVEVSHYVTVQDVQRYHQTNLRDIDDELSKEIIRTQTLLDNPIPIKMNKLDLNMQINQERLDRYLNGFKNAD